MIDARLAGEALSFSYDGTAVLSAVDVEVGRGELVGLIGPNGAGKTTLVRVLAGLTRPDQGRVVLGDRPIDEWSRRERARLIALVPQDPRVEFSFTVLEVVLMGRAPHLTGLGFAGPDDVRRARAALARLDLDELEARRLDTLSGGERQRVFLARALAQDPTILLLDEPTTHLDLRHQTEILDIVREGVRERGLAALAVLHDLNLAAVACDRLVLLAAGRVVEAGSPHDVLTRELIERAFATPVHVRRHDLADTPAILPMPRR